MHIIGITALLPRPADNNTELVAVNKLMPLITTKEKTCDSREPVEGKMDAHPIF